MKIYFYPSIYMKETRYLNSNSVARSSKFRGVSCYLRLKGNVYKVYKATNLATNLKRMHIAGLY